MRISICHLPPFHAKYPHFCCSVLQICYMASILKIGKSWRAQVRRRGHNPITQTFPTKALALEWARKVESEIDAKLFRDHRSLSDTSVADLIGRYRREIGGEKGFGKNKTAVLASLEKALGTVKLPALTDERLTKYVSDRRKAGAGGVTIGIDLTYLGGILRTAKELWKLPVSLDPVEHARAAMRHMKISTRSKERNRRPTHDELDRICDWFDGHSAYPMRDIIHFAIETAMRLDEIMRIKWADLNDADKTIIIRDRKDPKEKHGNDQEVPLLGKSYSIVKRQPEIDERIFPYLGKTVSSIFPRACNALGIEDLRFHDLRHEGVSRLFEQGYTIEQVALVSGHRDWKMLARYTQIRAKDLHR